MSNVLFEFIYTHTLCFREAKALLRLRICAGLTESSLLVDPISTTISCACPFIYAKCFAKSYNHATSCLAIYSHEASRDKLSEAENRQSIIVIQVHDKLHEKLFIFYMLISLNKWKWLRICLKTLKNLFNNAYGEKLIEAFPMWTYNICYWK